jgi:hypothetical protein
MKMCAPHWQTMRDAIEEKGLSGLVAKSGEAAMDAQVRQIEEHQRTGSVSEQTTKETFDPLMSMHWHFSNNALRCGGLYIMGQREDGENDGHYCPLCEFEKNAEGFVAREEIGKVADQMRDYCINEGVIARPS